MIHRVLPYVIMAGLFFLSSLPGYRGVASPGLPIPQRDKVVHALAFAVLLVSFRPPRRVGRAAVEWLPGAVVTSTVFACLDEAHQAWVPGRTSSWEDFLADGVGIAAAAVAVVGVRWSPPNP